MYYLATRPETVVSVITHGKLPSDLPNWLATKCLFCAHLMPLCFNDNHSSAQQTFVLELDILRASQIQEEFLFLETIDTTWIKRIVVYSTQAENLLKKLFKNVCQIPIAIEPHCFSAISSPLKKRPYSEMSKNETNTPITFEPPNKKLALWPNRQTNFPSESSVELVTNSVDRLSTYAEHIELLKSAFMLAKKSLLITTYKINHETLEKANLYELLPLARQRGVKIYIYYNDQKEIEPKILTFLKDNKVACNAAYTHSKLLTVDNHWVAAGSCNWLSIIDAKYMESEEGSLVIKGEICKDLIEHLWKYLKYYRNLQFANKGAVYNFLSNFSNNSTFIYELAKDSELGYLPTLDQHCGFFQACFKEAKERLIICSPFISSTGEYKDDIDYQLLKKTIARGINIYFICDAKSDALPEFRAFLAKVNSSKIQLITLTNFHLKTIIMDNNMITEGSFNWLSAMRDDMSDYHNHEQTLYVKGKFAEKLIADFFESRFGMLIAYEINNLMDSTNNVNHFSFFTNPLPSTASILPLENAEEIELQTVIEASLNEYIHKYFN